ncbi:hypothetical protein [Thalassospira sp.]|uniref:hypothetical protein n=1 Tax=Thalassospira sp. TaxID=1912094 RepID=UPI003AA7E714
MRVIKALVAFMGILIVVGIGLVAYGLSLDKNSDDTNTHQSPAQSEAPSVPVAGALPAAPASPLAVFGDITIEIAAGERLVDYSLNGQQAVLHIERPEGKAARLVIVSLAAKKVIGQVVLKTSEQ